MLLDQNENTTCKSRLSQGDNLTLNSVKTCVNLRFDF